MSDFICQFANCEETDTFILVTNRKAQERARFCCKEHAARYLLRDASLSMLDRVLEDHQ